MKNADKPMHPLHPNHDSKYSDWEGLTKREYFAAMAMQGLLANPEWMKIYQKEKYLFPADILAKISIERADALLKQLDQ